MTIAFSNKNVAEVEYGAVKKYDANSFLSGFWYVPNAFCEIKFESQGWMFWDMANSTRGCEGYVRNRNITMFADKTAKFSALPVFPDCKSASIFSSFKKCIGQGDTFIPLGIVARFLPSNHRGVSNALTMHSV